MTKYRGPYKEQGFSLVELLVAMVVLAIGIMATMAMQFSALAGYNSAREVTGASEMAQSVEQIMRAEARDWNQQGGPQGAQSAYANRPSIFAAVVDGGGWSGGWVDVFGEPVTLRMGIDDENDDGGRRYCVYVAGQEAPNDQGFAQVGIAVVYPASNSQWNDVTQCPDPGTGGGRETVELDTNDRIELEQKGYRATHLSTSVRAMDSQFQ